MDTNRDRLERLMRELGESVGSPARVYLTGGACAVLLGWRDMTLDVDLKADPELAGFYEALPRLKESLNINIKLASPDLFVPALPGWQDRSRFIAKYCQINFYHYDFYGQALAKIERCHARDQHDIANMLLSGKVEGPKLWELFQQVEHLLNRYPALDPVSLKSRVLEFASKPIYSAPLFSCSMPAPHHHLEELPGAELVLPGLEDLAHRRETIPALLVMIGSPCLRRANFEIQVSEEDALNADRRLYRILERQHSNAAHSHYNALIRRLVSFERAVVSRR